jgi:hypothetical protein
LTTADVESPVSFSQRQHVACSGPSSDLRRQGLGPFPPPGIAFNLDTYATLLRFFIAVTKFVLLRPQGLTLFMSTVTVAQLWAELFAEQLTASSWPPDDMLSKPWSLRRYAGYAGVMRSATSKPEDFAQLSGNLGDLDVLIAEASKHPYGSESARAYRRMTARAVPATSCTATASAREPGRRGWASPASPSCGTVARSITWKRGTGERTANT